MLNGHYTYDVGKQARTHKHIKQPRDIFDYLVYFFTFATPLLEIPQAIEIYTHRSAQDVSWLTWGFFCIDNLVWIAYAARKKLIPVLLTSILYEIIEVLILIGIFLYH